MKESLLIKHILARHGARPDVRLFRNPTSKVWVGKPVFHAKRHAPFTLEPGDVVLRGGRVIQAGLAEGSADLIGILRMPVANLDPAGHVGVFVSSEVKAGSTATEAHQVNWMEMIRRFGGIAGIVKSVEDVDELVGTP